MKVPSNIQCYVESLFQVICYCYQQALGDSTDPFCQVVFQEDTMPLIVFLLAFNPLLKLAAKLNQGHGYSIELPLQNSNSTIYVIWVEQGDEPPGWY